LLLSFLWALADTVIRSMMLVLSLRIVVLAGGGSWRTADDIAKAALSVRQSIISYPDASSSNKSSLEVGRPRVVVLLSFEDEAAVALSSIVKSRPSIEVEGVVVSAELGFRPHPLDQNHHMTTATGISMHPRVTKGPSPEFGPSLSARFLLLGSSMRPSGKGGGRGRRIPPRGLCDCFRSPCIDLPEKSA
jgi:hypothetical protein